MEIPNLITEMESLKVQEVEKVDQKLVDPDLSVKHDDAAHEPMKPEEKPNAARASALDTILKSLWKINVFKKALTSFTEVDQLRDFILNNLSLTHPMESNGVYDFLVTILELLPRWKTGNDEEEEEDDEPLKSKFEVYETLSKICNRCKMEIEYPPEPAYGLIVVANSLRRIKASHLFPCSIPTAFHDAKKRFWLLSQCAFEDLTFEKILKVERITLMMPCDKEGCGKRSYVERGINTLPSVFTIALEWENNETEEEISATTSVLATEIDISEIYKYKGDSIFTKYRLVSMVCLWGDQYSCIAYENKSWVLHFDNENEVLGDWGGVLSSFAKLKIRPEILFFENVMGQIKGTDKIVFGSLGETF
ncbi:unnamed protein product [Eruca vesicaria subsp. sativa]|uniref:Peptidase C19 ubiquitin carboxyl-terminal hydrolase domain-containing protein n=1 Tax=Eruca vesicaria subsp. sativa TaxID=29727 RepID=A0ABC8J093_ERUVS|nr:unnamed protein product [Eruca vesicaria subsp. sativa]